MPGYVANLAERIKVRRRSPGDLVFRRRSARHKLQLFDGPVWSLFITGRDKGRGWGYFVPGTGMVDRHEYRPRGDQL